jgi:hypothetical protein
MNCPACLDGELKPIETRDGDEYYCCPECCAKYTCLSDILKEYKLSVIQEDAPSGERRSSHSERSEVAVQRFVHTCCPFCGVRKTGHSLRCHIQACSMRNKPMDRKEKYALRQSTTAKP